MYEAPEDILNVRNVALRKRKRPHKTSTQSMWLSRLGFQERPPKSSEKEPQQEEKQE